MSNKLKYQVLDTAGKEVGQAELNPDVFGVEVDSTLLHQVVRWQQAKKRAGTHATLNRSKMDNTKKKMYRQKGTGRSRAGSRYSHVRVGGAVAHGPQPKSYEFGLNKKQKSRALFGSLSLKCQEQELKIIDQLSFDEAKTKHFAGFLKAIGSNDSKVLVVMQSEADATVKTMASNIPGVNVISSKGLNVYDILNSNYVVFDKACLADIEERVKNGN